MIWFILFGVFFISLAGMVFLLIKKIPALRVMDVSSIPKEQMRKIKERIILQRFQRANEARWKGITTVFLTVGRGLSTIGRRLVQKLYSIEQSYQKLKRTAEEGHHSYDTETIRRLTSEAEALIEKEEYVPAEKLYIDMISHNPKSVDAYEGLGNLYLENGQVDQARETLQFALRLSPNDASVLVSLAELENALDQPKVALVHVRKAIQKRPKNPKYLDYYIETSLRAGSLKDAQEGIRRLSDVNPENQKIPEFQERFLQQKNAYREKTHAEAEDASQAE